MQEKLVFHNKTKLSLKIHLPMEEMYGVFTFRSHFLDI